MKKTLQTTIGIGIAASLMFGCNKPYRESESEELKPGFYETYPPKILVIVPEDIDQGITYKPRKMMYAPSIDEKMILWQNYELKPLNPR